MAPKRSSAGQAPTRRSARIAASSRASSEPEEISSSNVISAIQDITADHADQHTESSEASRPKRKAACIPSTRAKRVKLTKTTKATDVRPFNTSEAIIDLKLHGATYWRSRTDSEKEDLALALSQRLQDAAAELNEAHRTIREHEEIEATRQARIRLYAREESLIARHPEKRNYYPQDTAINKAWAAWKQQPAISSTASVSSAAVEPVHSQTAAATQPHVSKHATSQLAQDSDAQIAPSMNKTDPTPRWNQTSSTKQTEVSDEDIENAEMSLSSDFSPADASTPVQNTRVNSELATQGSMSVAVPARSSLFRRVFEKISSPFLGRPQPSAAVQPPQSQASQLQPLPVSRKRSAPEEESEADPDSPLYSRKQRTQARAEPVSSSPQMTASSPRPEPSSDSTLSGQLEPSQSTASDPHQPEAVSRRTSSDVFTPTPKRVKLHHFQMPSSNRPGQRSSLSTLIEYTEPLSASNVTMVDATPMRSIAQTPVAPVSSRAVSQTPSSSRAVSQTPPTFSRAVSQTPSAMQYQTPRVRSIAAVRRAQTERINKIKTPLRAWEIPPQPKEKNADRRLEKLKRFREVEAELDILKKDEEIREMGVRPTKRVKVDTLKRIPHRLPSDPTGTFRVPDIDSDDEIEVDEEQVSLVSNVFEAEGVETDKAVPVPSTPAPPAAIAATTASASVAPPVSSFAATSAASPPQPLQPPQSHGLSEQELADREVENAAFRAKWGIPDTVPRREPGPSEYETPEYIEHCAAKFLRGFEHWKRTGEIIGYGPQAE